MSDNKILIDKDKALQIATKDALKIYRDITIYTVKAVFKENQWFIDFDITDPTTAGGGPHYIINAMNGVIVSFRYEQ